ncbi:hypothetical protein F2Q70_00022913 [Brassica cretica]|uniref:Uncharacterized protein n=1 Tax=Brassica cretica TaxID=69181 RepID=A0A8S9GRE2_BRACR|nr:hypothetical protein F2Q70_00022913 [Brassica cretica]
MPYLTNQEGLSHETNFNGLYTQEGVHPILNQSKIFTEQEVINFTSQRFSSPSIYFQKAQDQEKWPRNYEVKIQSPKPVNPVLHWPQLEATRFNQLQTRHWRPGDHFNQSGDILGVQEEFYQARDRNLSSTQEGPNEALLSIKTVQVQEESSFSLRAKIP